MCVFDGCFLHMPYGVQSGETVFLEKLLPQLIFRSTWVVKLNPQLGIYSINHTNFSGLTNVVKIG